MKILYLLIPLGFMVMGVALWAIIWAVKNGQFEDLEGPAHRILMDDDDPMVPGFDTAADKSEQAKTDLKNNDQ
ncbi:MAG: cbb3-type cytochrome oxidase assembly protein CcoS [Gammaproteobacteria bacterium]|nr:cbb3-type cytochrome oxidase assembly protein CcoS [Gammaproteobacteria bacterium]